MSRPPDIFTAMDVIGDYIERGCVQHKTYYSGICPVCGAIRRDARAGLAEIRRVIDLLANDTTAADLAQEIEFMKAEAARG